MTSKCSTVLNVDKYAIAHWMLRGTMTPNTRWNQPDIRRFASIGGEVTALKVTSVILRTLGINNQESQESQGKRPQGFQPASMAPTVIG